MNAPRLKTAIAAAFTLLFSASLLLARQGVLKTREGKTLEGDIEERPDQVVITMHGIKTTVNRDDINGQVEYFDNVEARYQAKVAALPKKPSAADHLTLARWLFDVKSYDLALKEIDEARKIDPNSADAQTLEATVMSQRRMEKNKPPVGTGVGTGPAVTPNPGTGPAVKPPASEKKFLTAEDINTIRQMEWRKDDQTVPRVTVPVDVRRRYVDLKALDPGNFAGLSMPEQAYYILTDPKAPADMKHDIKLTTDPQALVEFRRTIQPLVVTNCATAGCHGGHNAGNFYLFGTNTDREEVAYTNFYILQSYKNKPGLFAGQVLKGNEYAMIERTYPDRSILTQFALKPDAAETKHPEIKGQVYKPIAVNKQAAGYKTLINWMKGLTAGEPDYGIKYELPTSAPPKATPDVEAPKTDAPKVDAPKTDAAPTDPKTPPPVIRTAPAPAPVTLPKTSVGEPNK